MMVVKLLSPRPNTTAKVEDVTYIGFENYTPVLYIRNKEILLSKEECVSKGVCDFKRIRESYNYYVLTPEEIKELKVEYL